MMYKGLPLAHYDVEELHSVLDEARAMLAVQDGVGDTHGSHDTRCLIDQVTAELEGRDEVTSDED